STAIGAVNGYVLSKWRFRGSNLFFGMLSMGGLIPFQEILRPRARPLGSLGIASGLAGLSFVRGVYGTPLTTRVFRNDYVAIPDDRVKVARVDGAGFWRILLSIILPLSGPLFVVSVSWEFAQVWTDFLFGVVFSSGGSQPVMVALDNLVNTSTGTKEY